MGRPYVEYDAVSPSDPFGATMAYLEHRVRELFGNALIIRSGPVFGPWESRGFIQRTLARLHCGREVKLSARRIVSPTYLPDLVHSTLDLLIDGETGVWHLANGGETSLYDLASEMAMRARVGTRTLSPLDDAPFNTALTSARGSVLPPLEHGIARFFADWSPTAKIEVRVP
jgi:dTDP-4-dehydrorhamnose reductase